MKYAILAVVALLSTSAFAQQAAEKTYTITVSVADLNVIAQGLGEVPAKLANPVIAKLNAQIQASDAPKKPEDDKPKP